MHLKDNILNFVCDTKYYISFYDSTLHLFNYKNIENISDNQINISFNEFKVTIQGQDFMLKKLKQNEVLIVGIVKDMHIKYE